MVGVSEGVTKTANYYDTLGVSEGATADEIKAAYYDAVRRFRPDDYPDQFQALNDALRTLSDPRRRGEYDQMRRSGRRVQVLLDQAAASLDKDRQKAVSLLKSAIAIAPDMVRPRALLAHTLMRMEDFAGAERQYRWLVRGNDHDENLLFKLARCLWLQENLTDADTQLAAALRLNPVYYDALLLRARIYEQDGRRREAVSVLEKAIAPDGVEDEKDLPVLVRLLVFQLSTEEENEVSAITRRIQAVLQSEGSEPKIKSALRLCACAEELLRGDGEAAVAAIMDIADDLLVGAVGADEAAERVLYLRCASLLCHEARQAHADALLTPALQSFIMVKYLDRAGDVQWRARMEIVLNSLHSEITLDPRHVGAAIDYLRRQYPAIASDQGVFLHELATRVIRRTSALALATADNTGPHTMPIENENAERNRVRVASRRVFGWRKPPGAATPDS